MRELLGGAAENLREPLDSFLMRHIYEGAIAEDIRQAVRGGVRLSHFLRRPKVPSPRRTCQRKENCEGDCHKNRCQNLTLHARDIWAPDVSETIGFFTSMVKLVR